MIREALQEAQTDLQHSGSFLTASKDSGILLTQNINSKHYETPQFYIQ